MPESVVSEYGALLDDALSVAESAENRGRRLAHLRREVEDDESLGRDEVALLLQRIDEELKT